MSYINFSGLKSAKENFYSKSRHHPDFGALEEEYRWFLLSSASTSQEELHFSHCQVHFNSCESSSLNMSIIAIFVQVSAVIKFRNQRFKPYDPITIEPKSRRASSLRLSMREPET
ncbi:hypothetical protein VNO77_20378 [Canavalia gladiata]|uniref:Uncharacterized protein n=1 Tax=Canavalia gladiata TaxID=3824 RepID=A0AAN9LTF8_CANGL